MESNERRTDCHAIVPVRLLEEAVDFPHLTERCFRPPISSDDGCDLVPQRLSVLGMRSEVVQGVRKCLQKSDA